MNAVVVPTNSPERVQEFLSAWQPWPWDLIVVVRDAPTVDFEVPDGVEAYAWQDIDRMLSDPSIISRGDSAIRSFGFWLAWRAGAEIIFTLDDDCHPADADFVARHRANLFQTPASTSSVPGLRVRGLPYRDMGVLHDVQLSMGLWRGAVDLDAIATLAAGRELPSLPPVSPRVMPSHQFFPMSGMNLAFPRSVAPLMYFPPMGQGQRFARFDDIWCGLLVQRIFRQLGYSIVCGPPVVDHRRASDPFVNLVKEAPGVGYNEHLWRTLDEIPLTATDPMGCMLEAGAGLATLADEFLARWARGIAGWCELFDAVAVATPASAT